MATEKTDAAVVVAPVVAVGAVPVALVAKTPKAKRVSAPKVAAAKPAAAPKAKTPTKKEQAAKLRAKGAFLSHAFGKVVAKKGPVEEALGGCATVTAMVALVKRTPFVNKEAFARLEAVLPSLPPANAHGLIKMRLGNMLGAALRKQAEAAAAKTDGKGATGEKKG